MVSPQFKLFQHSKNEYGGELLKKDKSRRSGRPLDTKNTMHLVLRSSQAVGDWSFMKKDNRKNVADIIARFSADYGVQILSLANVGNHLHFQIKLSNRYTYKMFIKAITGSIGMAVTGASQKKKLNKKFWDYRPFKRVVIGFRAMLTLKNDIEINQLVGLGCHRIEAYDNLDRYRKQSSELRRKSEERTQIDNAMRPLRSGRIRER